MSSLRVYAPSRMGTLDNPSRLYLERNLLEILRVIAEFSDMFPEDLRSSGKCPGDFPPYSCVFVLGCFGDDVAWHGTI